MKKSILYTIGLAACLLVGLVACEEVDEVGRYDNWRARNEAFADSVAALSMGNLVGTAEDADRVPEGTLFAIQTSAGTTDGEEYVYCKKILRQDADWVDDGFGGTMDLNRRPYLTDSVSVYYYGTLINGDRFDGNFVGYGAQDRGTLNPDDRQPTAFDSPSGFNVDGVIVGWTWALQYMRRGERWMLYIPYASGYGTTDNGSIPAYSLLTFDVILNEVSE